MLLVVLKVVLLKVLYDLHEREGVKQRPDEPVSDPLAFKRSTSELRYISNITRCSANRTQPLAAQAHHNHLPSPSM